MKQSEFEEPIEILFTEWDYSWDWIKIIIYKFQKAEEVVMGESTYWIFEGRVISKDNPLRIENSTLCHFHFSKYLFKREIKKHLLLHTFDWDALLDITLEIKRTSKFGLIMRNVEYALSDKFR